MEVVELISLVRFSAKTSLAKDLQFPANTFTHKDTAVNPPK